MYRDGYGEGCCSSTIAGQPSGVTAGQGDTDDTLLQLAVSLDKERGRTFDRNSYKCSGRIRNINVPKLQYIK